MIRCGYGELAQPDYLSANLRNQLRLRRTRLVLDDLLPNRAEPLVEFVNLIGQNGGGFVPDCGLHRVALRPVRRAD